MHEDDEEHPVAKKKSEAKPKRRRKPEKIVIPRRTPSVVIPGRQIIFITPDKTTCEECTCFPKEDPYIRPKKLNPCLKSPLTLYEYAAAVVDSLEFPEAFQWSQEEVAHWMAVVVGLPQYKDSVIDNMINGRRLLMLEDPSHLPAIGIKNFEHIQIITSKVHQLFATDFLKFSRSVGLPPRKPLTHCTWFKARTGPSWGVHVNWSRCDVLRWMKILKPEPSTMDHWDLVWYRTPEFPKVKYARIKESWEKQHVPQYRPPKEEICRECLVPRKFKIERGIPDDQQFIWIERPPSPVWEKRAAKKKVRVKPQETRVYPKPVSSEGLTGKHLLLARRKMSKPKFYPEK